MTGATRRPSKQIEGREPATFSNYAGWSTIRGIEDYRAFIAADLAAHGLKSWRFWLAPKYPELHYQRLLRSVEFLTTKRGALHKLAYAVQRLRLARRSVATGISIPPGVFGPGLSIAHYGNIVVNDKARVGSWCRIHSGTNIGVSRGSVPNIGSHVYIAPGAVIYGAVQVGDGAVIGANSVVNADVPPGVTVGGAPARTIADRDSREVMPEWFPSPNSEAGAR